MDELRIQAAAEQVAEHLRREVAAGVWQEEMPGIGPLKRQLGVNHKTVDAALALLERQGVLESQGQRKPRRIREAGTVAGTAALRIGFLLREKTDRSLDFIVEARHRLIERGHQPFFARKCLLELGQDQDKVAALVGRTEADAWVVQAAPRPVIEWFAARNQPCFALFGFFRRVDIAAAGPDKSPAYMAVAEELVRLGHRRIALLARPQRRVPLPGHPERHFLQTLTEAGIEITNWHFPIWKETREDFHRCIEDLFRNFAPTALLVDEPPFFAAVQQFLAARGLRVPQDVSLVCTDPDPTFRWQIPSVAHISWKPEPWVNRLMRWTENTARGRRDRRKALTKAEFVPGGTIGPMGGG